jgi:hypothetical protein
VKLAAGGKLSRPRLRGTCRRSAPASEAHAGAAHPCAHTNAANAAQHTQCSQRSTAQHSTPNAANAAQHMQAQRTRAHTPNVANAVQHQPLPTTTGWMISGRCCGNAARQHNTEPHNTAPHNTAPNNTVPHSFRTDPVAVEAKHAPSQQSST